MENLDEALKTAMIFLNTLGYTTNIDFNSIVYPNFLHHKKFFMILNTSGEMIGKIYYYNFNNKILISLDNKKVRENNITGKWDIAMESPHTINGYMLFKEKYRMAITMNINASCLVNKASAFLISFKGEYIADKKRISFAIGENEAFWLGKTWPYNKEILSINIHEEKRNCPLLKHTVISQEKSPYIEEEKIYKISPEKLEGIKRILMLKKKEQNFSLVGKANNFPQIISIFMKNLYPNYQENIINFNRDINGLLAHFIDLSLANYTNEEVATLFGIAKEKVNLEKSFFNINEYYSKEKVLTRRQN